jgi:hypothetical protein
MPDPLTLTLVASYLGPAAVGLLKKLAEDRAESLAGRLVDKAVGLWKKDDLTEALKRAYGACMESILGFLKSQGYDEADLASYKPSFEVLLEDEGVGREIDRAIDGAADWPGPDAEVFRQAWERVKGLRLPPEFQWSQALQAFKKQVERHKVIPPELKDKLPALQRDRLLQEVRLQGGVRPAYDLRRYAARMREKYRSVDLSAMERPGQAGESGALALLQVFLPQDVREDPPKVEIPRDLLRWMEGKEARAGREGAEVEDPEEERLRKDLERARESYARQPRQPVLDVLGRPDSRKLVLLGDPGAGKSALTRFLLLTLLGPVADGPAAALPEWAAPFAGHLPLLVEIKDFLARRRPECETFVEYLHLLGEVEGYHLEQTEVDECLRQEATLVLFDGLDEVFDAGDRERISHQVAGFAATYPRARVVVTSRPVGYQDGPLRGAGFRHFALQELSKEQIEFFVRRWYDLTFPGRPEEAAPRVERVLGAVAQSRSIELLAGNPLLLTVMVLLGRQQELPRERAAFYQHAAEVLCHHWDVNKHLREAGVEEYVGLDDKREILRRLAFRMQSAERGLAGNFLREEELQTELEGYFRGRYQHRPGEAKAAARAMVAELRERNYVLCLYGPGVYGFVHRTFLEYFCAAELVRRLHEDPATYSIEWLLEDVYGRHWEDPAWHEVLRLICGMAGDKYAGRIIEFLTQIKAATEAGLMPRNLTLATYCLSEVRNRSAIADAGHHLLWAILQNFRGDIYEDSILAAAREVGAGWPGSLWLKTKFFSTPFAGTAIASRPLEAQLIVIVLAPSPELCDYLKRLLHNPEWSAAASAALVLGWGQNSEVRQLLFGRVRSASHEYVRRDTLEALASGLNHDPMVRQLCFEAARNDTHTYVRRSAFGALARELDPVVKRTVSRDLDGVSPFLEPHAPLGFLHLMLAAARLGLTPDELKAKVAEASRQLGWNLLEGLQPSPK